jgi:hypothetical protein
LLSQILALYPLTFLKSDNFPFITVWQMILLKTTWLLHRDTSVLRILQIAVAYEHKFQTTKKYNFGNIREIFLKPARHKIR